MFRWDEIIEKTLYGMTVKMYREPFSAEEVAIGPFVDLEFDHYAYKYFGDEIYMYRILDINFERYMEERGDLFLMGPVSIPTLKDQTGWIL